MRGSLGIAAAVAIAFAAGSPTWLAAQAAPAGATFKCGDGTYSTAATARGACSRHGGVSGEVGRRSASAARTPASAREAPAERAPAAGTASVAAAGATFRCGDGTYSSAASARGACSRHGGVAESLRSSPSNARVPAPSAAEARTEAPRAAASREEAAPRASEPAPAGHAKATAVCKDGTYSESQHRTGTCSRHGGVQRWLRETPN